MESVHPVSVAVVDPAGRLVARAGNPDFPTFLRSAAKPFQALPLIEDGVTDRFRITDAELALCCASHNSEKYQVDLVRGLLERIGCTESDLACGPHRSLLRELGILDRAAPTDPKHAEVKPSPIASNCSGKHTGMLALARHHGWETSGYHLRDHPVQQRCRATLAHWAGTDAIDEGVDGCGVVCFRLPLRNMAHALARLGSGKGMAERTVVGAMTTHPDLVAGRGRLDTALMLTYPGKLLAKVGAEGVYGAVLLESGLGIALKVEDGHGTAAMVALIAILDALDLKPRASARLPEVASVVIANTRGETTGMVRATGSLTFD